MIILYGTCLTIPSPRERRPRYLIAVGKSIEFVRDVTVRRWDSSDLGTNHIRRKYSHEVAVFEVET